MEQITLDLIPGKVLPVCHASQYDVGRQIRINLTDAGTPYTLDGTETITADVRKTDGCIVTEACTVVASRTYVDLITTQQMTACFGLNLCELKIEKGADTIGTLNFILDVEEDPLDEGIASQSAIHDLQAQVDADVLEALSNYGAAAIGYDNTQSGLTASNVQDAIDELAGDTKSAAEITYDNSQSGLAATDVQDALDEIVGGIGNLTASDIGYDNSQSGLTASDTQSAIDETNAAIIALLPIIETEPAPIANFSTDLALPLKSLKVEIKPKQASGTPTPSNPLPISGTDTVVVTQTGANLWDEEWELGYIDTVTGQTASDTVHIRSKNYIPVTPSTTFYNKGYTLNILQYRADYSYIGNANTPQGTFITDADCHYIKFYMTATTYNNDISINYPSTDTAYHAHVTATTKTVSIPSIVYGGEVDVIGGSGESNYSSVDLGSLSWLDTSTPNVFYATVSGMKAGYTSICYCPIYEGYSGYYTGMSNNQVAKNSTYRYVYIKDTRFASASEIGNNLDGIMLYYPVDTPTPITLANPIELTAISGVNNVFGDTDGNASVEFRESVQKYVDDNIAAVQALI